MVEVDATAVVNRYFSRRCPDEAGCEQNISGREFVSHEKRSPRAQCVVNMTELFEEIGSCSRNRRWRFAINLREAIMPSDDIEGGCVKLHCDEEAPLKPLRA